MKTELFYSLLPGHTVILKPDRQAAYSFATDQLAFIRVQERDGYDTPWIMAINPSDGKEGYFKPSEFRAIGSFKPFTVEPRIVGLSDENAERLLWLVERAYGIRHRNCKWTAEESERSWRQWDEEAAQFLRKEQR